MEDDHRLKHFFHRHRLSFIEVGEEDDRVVNKVCDGCTDIIHGPTYACMTCSDEVQFVMHKSCAEFPPQIHRDALHPHPLRFNENIFIVCDRCGILLLFLISYKCIHCMFSLDFRCAVAFCNDDELLNHEALQKGSQIKTTIHHFCHNHPLTRSLFLPPTTKHGKEIFEEIWGREAISCLACKKQLQQETTIYICLPCRFILHESCLNRMPKRVQSPFHPQHILLPRVIPRYSSHECYACRQNIEGISFYCNQCDVNLHLSCAKHLTRAVKLINCHPHHLLLHLGESITTEIPCEAWHCRTERGDFFDCKECRFCIHVECISLPAHVEHIRHMHPLVLINSVIEDDAKEYYCDICETERNPEHHVYYCRECNYIAHVDCVVPDLVEPAAEEVLLDLQQIEESSNKRLELDNEKIIQKDALHPHPLTLNEDHAKALFVCDSCGEVGCGLSYCCSPCQFNLHAKCAAALNNDEMTKKGSEIKTTIPHFSHDHQLTRCKIPDHHPFLQSCCSACKQGVCGVMYICLFCEFFIIHESCLEGMPLQLRSQFHPQHLLFIYMIHDDYSFRSLCDVCNEKILNNAFVCLEYCNIAMHNSCATYKTREIMHDSHVHSLVHLGKTIFVNKPPTCGACGAKCENTLFGCIRCKVYSHLECIKQLPYVVKHKRHLYSLTLTNSVVEDDTENYCCDVCETERNPEHDVYYCKECNYIAHIHCLINLEVISHLNIHIENQF